MKTLKESILSKSETGKSIYFVINLIRIMESYYNNGNKISDVDKSLLERLWKEYDLEIPGMKWYFTRYDGLQYGPAEGLCVPVVQIYKSDCISLSVRNRAGIDYAIKSLYLPHWETVAKKETKKITDTFLRKYDKKLSNILNMKSIEEENKFFISIYELN